jgi:hypothetical protein
MALVRQDVRLAEGIVDKVRRARTVLDKIAFDWDATPVRFAETTS